MRKILCLCTILMLACAPDVGASSSCDICDLLYDILHRLDGGGPGDAEVDAGLDADTVADADVADADSTVDADSEDASVDADTVADADVPPIIDPVELIEPENLVYQGAFRFPYDEDPSNNWGYANQALAYNPYGDSGGSGDGYPGSLYMTGHPWHVGVGEVSIPEPVISETKNAEELPVVNILHPIVQIHDSLFWDWQTDVRIGLQVLGPQGNITIPKLYFCFGEHFQEEGISPSHGFINLDLETGREGAWTIRQYTNYSTSDYLFEIPEDWAEKYIPEIHLATGRFRDGGNGGRGPSLFAIAPWKQESPLIATPLLYYPAGGSEEIDGYHNADEWFGGAWLTSGNYGAVIYVGTKAFGRVWYGWADGTVYGEDGLTGPGDRGWWGQVHAGEMLFYNPNELAAVALGQRSSGSLQPYAILPIDQFLFRERGIREKNHVGDVAFDRAHGIIYMMEQFGDDDRPIIHVFRLVI